MATAGTGDVLSGIIASMAAQGMDSFHAAAIGVWLHSAAGDLAAQRLGEASVMAMDLVHAIPDILNKYRNLVAEDESDR